MSGDDTQQRRWRTAGGPALRDLAGPIGSLAIVGILLAGCGLGSRGCESVVGQPACTHGPTAAAVGMSRDAAVARARAALPATGPAPVVVWASIESNPFSPRGTAPPGPLTWVVRLQGGLTASPCPSGWLDHAATTSDPACLDGDGGIDMVLDYYTGHLLGWIH